MSPRSAAGDPVAASFATTGTTRVVLLARAVLLEIATPTVTIVQQSALPRRGCRPRSSRNGSGSSRSSCWASRGSG
jgi:hypothetical protein